MDPSQDASALRLVTLTGVTPPEGAIVTELDLPDRTRLRAAYWRPQGKAAAGTILVCPGRTEFIEKYFEVVRDLLGRGFAVVVFDWRGQGLSTRALPNRQKGHVADFRLYGDDLDAVIARVLIPFCPKPYFALAHSMGAAVMIHHLHGRASVFERVVLSAPMVDIHRLPLSRNMPLLVAGLSRIGLRGTFLPQARRTAVFEKGFESNLLTSDRDRFAAMLALMQQEPDLAIGRPTVGWLDAAFRAMLPFADDAFCRAIAVPILVVVPGSDRVVSVPAMERFARRLRAAATVRIAHARHEILLERDELRNQFWAAFDAFVPGES